MGARQGSSCWGRRAKMGRSRTGRSAIFVCFSLLLHNAVLSVYFPLPSMNVTLPDFGGLPRSPQPILKVLALQDASGETEYGIRDQSGGDLFHIRRNEITFDGSSIRRGEKGRRHHVLEVDARSESGDSATATVSVHFSEREFLCDDLKREMCFWTEGRRFTIRKSQKPTQIGYLPSEFLLRTCNNYTVVYQVLSGRDCIGVGRTKNTNADSWVLSLARDAYLDGSSPCQAEVGCSVSTDKGPAAVFRQLFQVEFVGENENLPEPGLSAVAPKNGDGPRIWRNTTSAPERLRSLSLVAPELADRSKISLKYPKKVEISKFATYASRVAEPVAEQEPEETAKSTHSGSRSENFKKVAESGIRFRIAPNNLFRITETGGIVYVSNSALLRNVTHYGIRVSWTHPRGFVDESSIAIHVIDGRGSACENQSDSKIRKSCAQKTSEADCLRACGMSTGHLHRNFTFGCRWRDNDKPEMLSLHYRTCSPDLSTCPDRVCDPLEKIFPGICPQDCAEYIYGSANKDISVPGISSASGVCSCTSEGQRQSCTCDLLNSKKRQGNGRRFGKADRSTVPPLLSQGDANVSVVQAAESEECGMICLSSVVGGSAILIIGMATFAMILYHRRLKKRYPNQNPMKEDMININYEEYIDRSGEGIRISPHNPGGRDIPEYYDKKWEFPRYRLTMEQTIGEGEFGKVLKARAEGIGGHEGQILVAVKTLKENAKESELADLVSEYQLLKEVDHPNIIHLLGACTTLDGPLYIIIEYAKHGSLRNYLRRNRSFGSEPQMTDKERETSYMQIMTPKDILTFAWQIAKGMAYLTEMKLVHRDLAARNVLVAEGLICKISDFGLTRDIYEDDTYLKKSKGRVPVKWMALESLSDHIYTTKSDVWSYGIVLWELVTTGANPYPGIAAQNLFHLLKSGYRMEKPINCSPELYQILRSCWHENPSHRPAFKCLVSKLEEMLGEGKDYLDLNARIIENKIYFGDFASEKGEESEFFLHRNGDEQSMLKWKFDFVESCGCAPGEQRPHEPGMTYENGNAANKPKYENEGVQDSSYVQPNGEPKPVNSGFRWDSDETSCRGQAEPGGDKGEICRSNLHTEGDKKKICDIKKI